jgi:hypothetical protein
MRDVVRHSAYAVKQPFELVEHQVEALGKLLDIVTGRVGRDTSRQTTGHRVGQCLVDDADAADTAAAQHDAFHQRAWMSREATGNIRWMPAVSTNT